MSKLEALLEKPVTNADVSWACEIMGLPSTAFSGVDGNDPRLEVIKNLETLDVEACPGSGKTTLLVAKLAILARRWRPSRMGICVLSHTNVARNEIEEKLGSCAEGSALLRYPHFVGTIHSFVNEFLAVPWLKSNGNPVHVIDTDIALDIRWYRLRYGTRKHIELRNHGKQCVTYNSPDFMGGGKSYFREHTPTFKELLQVCKDTCNEGYFCYDEMFVWARQLLDAKPSIAGAIRSRFPLIFIDEVQDNSELQSATLHTLLFSGTKPSIRQRFGDSNQAIFQQDEEAARTDPFPTSPKADLPNSHRFGKKIADAANPLGVNPQGLIGQGPGKPGAALGQPQNAIFLFDDATILNVLPAYAKHLMATFAPHERASFHFSAVAAVHLSDDLDKIPRSIKHYVPDYDGSISRRDSSPATLIQFLRSSHRDLLKCGDTNPLVTRFATGLLRLAQIANPAKPGPRRKSPHQSILESLEPFPVVSTEYRRLVVQLIRQCGQPTAVFWDQELRPAVVRIVASLAGHPVTGNPCSDFLTWDGSMADAQSGTPETCTDNIYRYPSEAPEVLIHLGSVHSVKGETHAATLVLESYFHKHHLRELKPWLLGIRQGGAGQVDRTLKRLRVHYVAMTRPAHLLCLAMRSDALTESDRITLTERGWRVISCETPQNADNDQA